MELAKAMLNVSEDYNGVVAVDYKGVVKIIAKNEKGQLIILDDKDIVEINTQAGYVVYDKYKGLYASPMRDLYKVVTYALMMIDIEEKVHNGCDRLTATLAVSLDDDARAKELAEQMRKDYQKID